MKLSVKRIGKKILSLILCLITLFSAIPIKAWTNTEGEVVSSQVGENYVGLDGRQYYFTKDVKALIYDDYGGTSLISFHRDRPLEKFYLIRGGEKVNAFCIEGGTSFKTTTNGYRSTNYNNSSFFNNLPYSAQYGIMATTVYAWRKDLPSELEGQCNMDDFQYATQLIIWEYQQQIRTSPTSISSKNGIDADMYYHSIKGRTAEKAYNWILKKLSNHATIPSFSSSTRNAAKTYTLKYNPDSKDFSLTITDTNNTLADLKFENSNGVTVKRSGNQYTFTSKNMITDAITITAQKDINKSSDAMLIWGGENQTMATGVSDPVRFYIKINTEVYGKAHLVKKSEDGIVEGIKFNIQGNGINKTVTTGANGTIDVENLLPGNYTVTEEKYDRYVTQDTQTVTIRSGQTSTVTFNNVLKKFRVTVTKSDKEKGTPQGDGTLEGANYGIFKGNQLIDQYTTDQNGQFTTKYYVCGDDWTLRELTASEGYLLDETVHHIGAEPRLYTVEHNSIKQEVEEQIIKGKISIIKHTDNGDTQIETPEVGAVFEIYLESSGSYNNAKETERDIITCDENGFGETKELPYGCYVVHQVSGWDNRELVEDFKVHIKENEKTYRYIINNKEFESYLKMEKVDKNTGKHVTLSNATFKLSRFNEDTEEWEKVECKVGNEYHDTWTTNSEGITYTETKLRSGTYKLEELKIPERIFTIR